MIITELTDKKLIKLVDNSGCYELQQRIEFNWKDCDGSYNSELEKLIVDCKDVIYHFEGEVGYLAEAEERAEEENDKQILKDTKQEYKATQKLLKKLLALKEKE